MKERKDKDISPSSYNGMRLLNPANMKKMTGGKTDLHCGIAKVYLCAYEVHCAGKGFVYNCSFTKFSASCSKGVSFSIGPANSANDDTYSLRADVNI